MNQIFIAYIGNKLEIVEKWKMGKKVLQNENMTIFLLDTFETSQENDRLYYGYTKEHHEILFSNGKEIEKVCESISELSFPSFLEENLSKDILESVRTMLLPFCHFQTKKNDSLPLDEVSMQYHHIKWEEVCDVVNMNFPVVLTGPKGSGKKYVARQIAKKLGFPFYYRMNISTESDIVGSMNQESEFYQAWKYGGIFLLDGIKEENSSLLEFISSSIEYGYMKFPEGMVKKHPNFRIIIINTLSKLRIATFDYISFDYDRKLEQNLYPNKEVLEFMWALRESLEKKHLSYPISTTDIGQVYRKERMGFDLDKILQHNVISNLKDSQLSLLIEDMKRIHAENAFYVALKHRVQNQTVDTSVEKTNSQTKIHIQRVSQLPQK